MPYKPYFEMQNEPEDRINPPVAALAEGYAGPMAPKLAAQMAAIKGAVARDNALRIARINSLPDIWEQVAAAMDASEYQKGFAGGYRAAADQLRDILGHHPGAR